MQKKKMLQEFLGHRFLVFALFMLIFSGGLKAAEEEYQKKKISRSCGMLSDRCWQDMP